MNKENLHLAIQLRKKLHGCPELSGNETVTLNTIFDFLKAHTHFDIERRDGWLSAKRDEGEGLPTIAFRGDMDAIPGENGPRHGCGHDGHSAILCGLALELDGMRVGKNVRLIFQHAEETGAGAKTIADTWEGLQDADRIYGLHNIPGHGKGMLLVREECFACASCGMVVFIKGRPAHAAYPADGANPSEALSRLVLEIPGMIEEILNGDDRLLMHTVVGLNIGGENFGLSASEGKLCVTLRGHRQADIDDLIGRIKTRTAELCAGQAMSCAFELRDEFPDTTCTPAIVSEACSIWETAGMHVKHLAEPMRWSEDFGWYLKSIPGMFFGIGSGETAPGLHTETYEFDDELIESAVNAFLKLAKHMPQ